MIDYIGYISATLTSLAFAPQAIKTIKTKETDSFSLGTYIIFNLGVLCWLVYGIMKMDWPIILANSVTFLFAFIILVLKFRHG